MCRKVPRWLAKAGRLAEAEAILARVGGPEYARREMAAIRETLEPRERRPASASASCSSRAWRTFLVLGVGLAVLQQWCGINVIFNYAQEVFQAAGYNVSGVMQNDCHHRRRESRLHLRIDRDASTALAVASSCSSARRGWR